MNLIEIYYSAMYQNHNLFQGQNKDRYTCTCSLVGVQ